MERAQEKQWGPMLASGGLAGGGIGGLWQAIAGIGIVPIVLAVLAGVVLAALVVWLLPARVAAQIAEGLEVVGCAAVGVAIGYTYSTTGGVVGAVIGAIIGWFL